MIHTQDPNAMLAELDLVEQAITTAQANLDNLLIIRDSKIRMLDAITSPFAQPCAPTRKMASRGYVYQGEHRASRYFIDIYLGVLRRLWMGFPEKRGSIAEAMARSGYSRRYIAQNRASLFADKAPEWMLKYSAELVDGWYADKNLNQDHMRKLLPIAVRAAGLRWNKDVKVYWR